MTTRSAAIGTSVAELVMADRPVDDVLDHLRDRGRRGQAAELRQAEDDHEPEYGRRYGT